MPNVRFQRRVALIPGWLYLNLSKQGFSLTLRRRGKRLSLSVTVGRGGIRFTTGVPGTGVSVSEKVDFDDLPGLEALTAKDEDKR
jgi:hypothetical protein